jgi:hypothetical protein
MTSTGNCFRWALMNSYFRRTRSLLGFAGMVSPPVEVLDASTLHERLGTPGAKVAELSKSAALRSLHELDDDAREIQFTKANVTMKLDAMLLRARTRGRYAAVDDREPELQAVVWWNKT